MFYYVIYNSTVLNYSNNNKKLNTFIYGTILYILSHGLINSYDNQFARYIKTYFWLILAIDIGSIYYMHNYLSNDSESEADNLKSLLDAFKLTKSEKENELKKEMSKDDEINVKNENKNEKNQSKENKEIKEKNNKQSSNNEPMPFQFNDNNNISLLDDNDSNNTNNDVDVDGDDDGDGDNTSEQMSDEGSDIDLDNFEMSLND